MRDERPSFVMNPTLRRRCIELKIQGDEPQRLEATIVSRRWKPAPFVRRFVGALPGHNIARALRRIFGREVRTKVVASSVGDAPVIRIGYESYEAKRIKSIALQGWQEEFGLSRVWDVMLLGPNIDVLVGHKSYDAAHAFAEKLAAVLGLQLEESSVVGGSVTVSTTGISVRDAHYDTPQTDGWRHLKR